MHGYLNSRKTDYMIYIKNALLQKEDANVILVGWRKGAMSPVYPNSAANTRVVGAGGLCLFTFDKCFKMFKKQTSIL